MLQLLRVPKQESQSLTSMLKDLRAREESGPPRSTSTAENEVVNAVSAAVVQHPPPQTTTSIEQLWTPELIAQVLGGLRDSGSPHTGFGGSSRAA
jgi:hypothetical protein